MSSRTISHKISGTTELGTAMHSASLSLPQSHAGSIEGERGELRHVKSKAKSGSFEQAQFGLDRLAFVLSTSS